MCNPMVDLFSHKPLYTTSCRPQPEDISHSNYDLDPKVCRLRFLLCLPSTPHQFFSRPPKTSIFLLTRFSIALQSPASLPHSPTPPSLPGAASRTPWPAPNSLGISFQSSSLCLVCSTLQGSLVTKIMFSYVLFY